jgi:hypothetical protein
MISLNGVYEDGVVKLERKLETTKKAKVIVTFLEDDLPTNSTKLTINNFSFLKSRERSKRYQGNLSEAIIAERKTDR